MAPLRGWGPRGRRVYGHAPFGRWRTSTLVAALRHDRIDAPYVFDGPINADSFRAYVKRVLAPTLEPGDIVVLDNLGSHKGRAVRRAVRARGAKIWFLPAYSPDLNPIEQAFAKIKTPQAKSPRAHPGANMATRRRSPRHPQTSRMRQLPHKLRIRFRMKQSRSNAAQSSPER